MTEQNRVTQVLSTGQVTFLFLVIVSTLVAIFAAGVYIGRSSQPTVKRDVQPTATIKTTNINFVETSQPANNIGKADVEAVKQTSAPQALPGVVLSAPAGGSNNIASYAVQVTTMTSLEDAQKLVTQLHRDGIANSHTQSPQPGSVSQLYSVEVGPYDTKDSAEQVAVQLKGKGLVHCRAIQVLLPR